MTARAGSARAFRLTPKPRGFQLRSAGGLTKTDLDAAKTVLRRKGFVVYDAEITEGKAWRGFIRCDHRTLTPDRVIEMARDIEAAP